MSGILTLAMKDLKLLMRDRFGLFWVLGFPLLTALLWGSLFSGGGGGGKVSIAVVDEDNTDRSKSYIEKLKAKEGLTIEELELQAARDKVRKGDLTAYLKIEKGFSPPLRSDFSFYWWEQSLLSLLTCLTEFWIY